MAGPSAQVSGNTPCPCGSGRKFKHCCGSGRGRQAGQSVQSVLRQAQGFYQRGNLVAAAALCREVLQARPDTPHAWFLVGMIQRREGGAAAAIASIKRALGLGLGDARVRYHYAEVLMENGRLDDAAEQLELALDQKPGFGEAWHLLGRLALQRGQFAPAADKLSRALALDPSNAALRTNLGTALLEQGRHEEAISQLREAAALKPEDAAIRYNLANAFRRAGRLDEAIREYRRVGTLSPDYAPALAALGACLAEQGDLDSALAYCEKALALAPNYAEAHNNLAVTLHRMGRLREAAERYRRALAIEPRSPRTHDNLGQVFYQMGRFEEAVQAYGEALAIAPEFDVARGNRALVHLAVGDFVKGWEDNRARESMRGPPQGLFRDPLPIDLSGKRVLVLRDQGVGDEILYLRFLPQLRARGAWTAYRPDPRIAAMCARLPFIDEVVEGDRDPDDIHFTISVGDLPGMLGMSSMDDIPLSIDIPSLPRLHAEMRERLTKLGPPPFIGVTWRAGTPKRGRSVPVDSLARTLRHVDGTIIALQRGAAERELEDFAGALGRRFHDLGALGNDLERLLALLDLLDDYLCVSNTNVDLRMACAKTSRIFVAHPPDFRWMTTGDQSAWFPGCRLYRQQADGGWQTAMATLREDLRGAATNSGFHRETLDAPPRHVFAETGRCRSKSVR